MSDPPRWKWLVTLCHQHLLEEGEARKISRWHDYQSRTLTLGKSGDKSGVSGHRRGLDVGYENIDRFAIILQRTAGGHTFVQVSCHSFVVGADKCIILAHG
jgi:hypothetical protein